MAIASDANSDGGVAFTDNVSWSHTCSAGSNRVLLVNFVIISFSGDASAGTRTVTYNGTPMTEIGQSGAGGAGNPAIFGFRLVNPASGAHTIALSTTASCFAVIGSAVSYTGVDQTTPEDVAVVTGLDPSATDFSLSITPSSAGCWTTFLTKNEGGLASAGTNSTQVMSSASGYSIFDSGGTVSSGVSYTMHATFGSTTLWNGVLVALRSDGVGSAGGPILRGGSLTHSALLRGGRLVA